MSEEFRFEILPAGEMKKKYGLHDENRPCIRLDPTKVPEMLRHLIPLAQAFGISDDLIRLDVVARTSPSELEEMRRIVREHDDLLDKWLAGPESQGRLFSAEYVAFTCLRMAADGC